MNSPHSMAPYPPSPACCKDCGNWNVFGGTGEADPIVEHTYGTEGNYLCPRCSYRRWVAAGFIQHERFSQVNRQRVNQQDSAGAAPSGAWTATNSPGFPSPQPESQPTQTAGRHLSQPLMSPRNPAFPHSATIASSHGSRDPDSDRPYSASIPSAYYPVARPLPCPSPFALAGVSHERNVVVMQIYNHFHFYDPTSVVVKTGPDNSTTDNSHDITNSAYGTAKMELRHGSFSGPHQGPRPWQT